jgi:hypothetical protein
MYRILISRCQPSSFFSWDLFAACCTLNSIKELKGSAPFVWAHNHQIRTTFFTGILHKGNLTAFGADNVKRPSAAGAYLLIPADLPQTRKTSVCKRVPAAAYGTKSRIPVYERVTADA